MLTFEQIIKDIQNKIFYPVYFFHGEEPYFIDQLTAYFEENVLDDSVKDFNQSVVYGRDVTPEDIIDLSKRFPMMGNYQMVVVKEAQDIQNIEGLEPYLSSPLNTTILVINFKYRKIDKRKTFYKKMVKSKEVILFESKRIYENQVPAWIEKSVHLLGYSINPHASRMLAEYLGADLGKINNELEKLIINLEKGAVITVDDIEANIGISKDFNIFELQYALTARNAPKAQRIVQHFEANPKEHPLQMLSVVLHNFFIKVFLYHHIKSSNQNMIASVLGVSPFFVRDYERAARTFSPAKIKSILAQIRLLDLKSKGVGSADVNSYGTLKELVFKIMH
ncbi:MAG: DNA polymerase III subunit delta [Bacteroidales bacterium]|nr:DNA polymerase III subunit delta [Bacteroidales bacterium]MCF6342940.1 DNA polymerase III subunit delta [Bacteroidales bacterium]